MSKFLLNLLVQISKALVYSKIKFYSEKISPSLSAHPAFRPSRGPFSFLFNRPFSPFPTGPRPLGRPSPPSRPNRSSSSSRIGAKRARRHRLTSRRPMVDPDDLHQKENNGLINPPLSGVISPLQSPVTGAFNPGPLKLLQRRPLKVLGLPRLASAL
jgi:hypothetical protein